MVKGFNIGFLEASYGVGSVMRRRIIVVQDHLVHATAPSHPQAWPSPPHSLPEPCQNSHVDVLVDCVVDKLVVDTPSAVHEANQH